MQRVKFDCSKLASRIKQQSGSMRAFAAAMNMSPAALSNRLHSRAQFSMQEIDTACRLLLIPAAECYEYFFTVSIEID